MYEEKYPDYKKYGLIQSYSEFIIGFETSGPFSPIVTGPGTGGAITNAKK